MKDFVYILFASFEGSVSVVSVFRKKSDALDLKSRLFSLNSGTYYFIEKHDFL